MEYKTRAQFGSQFVEQRAAASSAAADAAKLEEAVEYLKKQENKQPTLLVEFAARQKAFAEESKGGR